MKHTLLLLVLTMGLVLEPALGQREMAFHGLVVGISDYAAEGGLYRDRAEGGQYTARQFWQLLTTYNGHGQGWPQGNVDQLYGSSATEYNIRYSVQNNLPRGDGYLNLYYQSGHAVSTGTITYDNGYYTPSEMESDLGSGFERHIKIIDGCYSGGIVNSFTKGQGLSACSATEVTYNLKALGGTNDTTGVFTYFLIDGMTYNTAAGGGSNAVSA